MSQIVYRGNLSAKAIPLLTDFQGRSVIVPGNDNTFNRSLVSSEDQDRDVGVPAAYYCHNVLPAPFGFQSIGYDTLLSSGLSGFSSVQLLRTNPLSPTVPGPRTYFSPQSSGTHYVFGLGAGAWTTVSGSTPFPFGAQTTYATVQGITYIFFAGVGCYKYDQPTNALISVTLTSLTSANLLGISAYQGYLIAYDSTNIYWSSVLDIVTASNSVDFTPSLITGASNIRPEGTRGPITIVLPATFGLAIYTVANIVSAIYSGNSRYPFNFKEVVASGGCSSQDLVSYDANTGNQYAYTTSGLQTVTATATQTVFPEITDFLAGQDFEDFDEVTRIFSTQTLVVPMVKKIVSVADRYLIFSYGITSLTHAIVYDMTQKRYGKLKISHVAAFEYAYLDPTQADAPRRSLAFLQSNGTVKVVNPSVTFAGSQGVIVLGKFQYVRSRLLTLEELVIQTVHQNQSVLAFDLQSVTGGTVETATTVQGYEVSQSGEKQRIYKFHKTGVNHSILLIGGFFLSSFVLTFHIGGRR